MKRQRSTSRGHYPAVYNKFYRVMQLEYGIVVLHLPARTFLAQLLGVQNRMSRFCVSLAVLFTFCLPAYSFSIHIRTGELDNVQPVGYLPYHNGATLICGDCHISHGSQQHSYSGTSITEGLSSSPGLIKATGINELCLSCHDGKAGIPDVVGADINGLSDRSAGAFQNPGVDSWKGHSLASGPRSRSACDQCHATGKAELVCTDCHAHHGNKRPRNLKWASQPGDEPQFGLMVNPGASGMEKYESRNIAYATINTDALREVSNMCIDCHHHFSGNEAIGAGQATGHIMHPSYDSERSSMNTIADGASSSKSVVDHWNKGTGAGFEVGRLRFLAIGSQDYSSARIADASRNGVFCLTCHKAHGSSHSFGMAWDVAGGTSSKGCCQCHALGQ